MRFVLIRHAQSAPNSDSHQSEWGLSAAGEQSCQELAEVLETLQVTRIFTSHESKAISTGQLAAQHMQMSHSVFAGLEEQNNDGVGWFESAADFKAAVQKLFEQPDQSVFGPETADQAGNRFKAALGQIASECETDACVAVVTHGRVMTSFLQLNGLPDPVPFWRSLTFPDCVTIDWPQAKIIGRRSFDPA